jgi:hypothetical protein
MNEHNASGQFGGAVQAHSCILPRRTVASLNPGRLAMTPARTL